jgi:hypothetical protein
MGSCELFAHAHLESLSNLNQIAGITGVNHWSLAPAQVFIEV